MKFLAGDDLAEGVIPIESVLSARAWRWAWPRFGRRRRDRFERRERDLEVKLIVEMLGIDDLAQPGFGLAVPGARLTDRMTRWDI